jgi:hypothetical protein
VENRLMAMKKGFLKLPVTFDDQKTDLDSVSSALDTLMETALSTPGILDEYGVVEVGPLIVEPKKVIKRKRR